MQPGERERDEMLHAPSQVYFAGLGVSWEKNRAQDGC